MKPYLSVPIAAVLFMSTSFPALAYKPCDELRTEIAAKIIAKKIYGFDLIVVPDEKVKTHDRVVGGCNGGTQKITFKNRYGKDYHLNLGEGDGIIFGGTADAFDCDDPAFANVDMVQLFTHQVLDKTVSLCLEKSLADKKKKADLKAAERFPQGVISSTVSKWDDEFECEDPVYKDVKIKEVGYKISAYQGHTKMCKMIKARAK